MLIRPAPAVEKSDNPARLGEVDVEKISLACRTFQLIGGRVNSVSGL